MESKAAEIVDFIIKKMREANPHLTMKEIVEIVRDSAQETLDNWDKEKE